jgi:hypothetical protein
MCPSLIPFLQTFAIFGGSERAMHRDAQIHTRYVSGCQQAKARFEVDLHRSVLKNALCFGNFHAATGEQLPIHLL